MVTQFFYQFLLSLNQQGHETFIKIQTEGIS